MLTSDPSVYCFHPQEDFGFPVPVPPHLNPLGVSEQDQRDYFRVQVRWGVAIFRFWRLFVLLWLTFKSLILSVCFVLYTSFIWIFTMLLA